MHHSVPHYFNAGIGHSGWHAWWWAAHPALGKDGCRGIWVVLEDKWVGLVHLGQCLRRSAWSQSGQRVRAGSMQLWKASLETVIKCQPQGRTENVLLKYSRIGKAPGATPEAVTKPVRTQVGTLFWRDTVKAREHGQRKTGVGDGRRAQNLNCQLWFALCLFLLRGSDLSVH